MIFKEENILFPMSLQTTLFIFDMSSPCYEFVTPIQFEVQ